MHMGRFASSALLIRLMTTLALAEESKRPRRVVCIGDSIIEGHTYPFLVQQALREAGKDVPVFINAGVGGDTAGGMLPRLQIDVFDFNPNLAILSTAINDMSTGVSLADFEANYRKIIEAHRAKKIPLLLCTSSTLAPQHAEAFERLQQYNGIVRALAKEFDYPLAEVYDTMIQSPAGLNLWEDGAHLNFEGYRRMTRAVLDGLGHRDVPVPEQWKIAPEQGLIIKWQILPYNEPIDLTDAAVAALKPDDAWKQYELPEAPVDLIWWARQQQSRGVAWSLAAKFGPARRYFSHTILHSTDDEKVFFNTGAGLGGIFLNGERVWSSQGQALGWRMGGRRIPVTLRRGQNVVILESGDKFFFSVTKNHDW